MAKKQNKSKKANNKNQHIALKTISLIVIVLLAIFAFIIRYNKTSYKTVSPYKTQQEWQQAFVLPEYTPNNEIKGPYDESLAVKCENGIFVGQKLNDVISWKGIPYAKQPVGERRFKPAIAPNPSEKVYEAYNFGVSCMQPVDTTGGEKASLYKQGEDCLNLNIWSNVDGTPNKPVLVYIHGGGWIQGGTSDPLYNGQFFAQFNPDIIVITVTYRMGMMGMINLSSFPDGADYMVSTSNNLLDLVQSLKWIKNNIAAFGGDPNNITIAGESAGGAAVSALCIIPSARGLFQKAIAMSGSASQGNSITETNLLPDALRQDFNVKYVSNIQDIDFETIKNYWNQNGLNLYSLLIRDDLIYPSNPYFAWEQGKTQDLIIMQGHTSNEFRYFQDVFGGDEELFNAICETSMFNDEQNASPEFITDLSDYKTALYNLGYSEQEIPSQYMNDKTLAIGNTYQSILHANNGGIGYGYTFTKEYDNPKYFGAAHAIDCFYLFGTFDGVSALGTKQDVDLALQFQKMISNFCKYGNPSTDEHIWPDYNNDTRIKMIIGNDIYTASNPEGVRVDAAIRMIQDSPTFRYMDSFASVFPLVAKRYPELYKKFIATLGQQ